MLRDAAALYLDYRLGPLNDPAAQPLAWAIRQLFLNPHCALTGLDKELRKQAEQFVLELRDEFTHVLGAPGLVKIQAHESWDPVQATQLWQRIARLITEPNPTTKTRRVRLAVVVEIELPGTCATNDQLVQRELQQTLDRDLPALLQRAAKDTRLPYVRRACVEYPDLPRFRLLYAQRWERKARRKHRTPSESTVRQAVHQTFRRRSSSYVLHWNDAEGWKVTILRYHPDRRSQDFQLQIEAGRLNFIPVG